MPRITAISTALFMCLVASSVTAQIHVDKAWTRATPPFSLITAVYLSLMNHGDNADRLVRMMSPLASRVELHTTMYQNGLAKMRRLPALSLASHEHINLQPGGMHLMLFDLQHPLAAGERFSLVLEFEHAGQITVAVEVRSQQPIQMNHSDHSDHSDH